jgi:multidrug resistance efflux pump
VAARDEVHAQLMQTVGERDRLRREFDRLKNEHEAAAVEHRTALKSARDRLAEAQNRTAELEQQLASERQSTNDARPEQLRAQLADSLTEQARLRDELQRHSHQIERLNSGRPSDHDSQLIELARATQQLSAEQERVQALTRSLVESLHASETARSRSVDLQAKLAAQNAEREQYQNECERLRAELGQLRLQGLSGHTDEKALRDALASRQQAVDELTRVKAELAALGNQENLGELEEGTLNRLTAEQARIRTLEQQLADAKNDQLKNEQMFSEARSRLVQVSSDRDRLAAEVDSLKSRQDYSEELRTVRRRLLRARQRIRDLRTERDHAVARFESQAASVQELTAQIDRLRSTQRAAAEALGLSSASAAGFESRTAFGAMPESGHGSTSRLGAALQPLMHVPGEASSSQRSVPRALTRRVVGDDRPGGGDGFTSAFGRPAIPSLIAVPQSPRHPVQTKVFQVAERPHQDTPRASIRTRRWPWIAAGIAALTVGTFLLTPPLLPLSSYGMVTARLSTIKAPIDGKVTFAHLHNGAAVTAGMQIAEISNDTVDGSVLNGLKSQKAAAEETFGRLSADLAKQRQKLEAAGHAPALDDILRWHPHPGTGVEAALPARMAMAPADEFQQPGLAQQVAETTTLLAAARAEVAMLDGKISGESARLEALRHGSVSVDQAGDLWRRQVIDQGWVRTGDTIASFTDPTTLHVEALVPDVYLDRLAIGDAVTVQLLGDRASVTGKVRSLLPATQAPENQAGSLPRLMPGRFLMLVDIDPLQRLPTIGQGIKLIVLGQNPGPGRRLLAWLYEMTRF